MCLLFDVNNFQSIDEEQCSKYLEYINLLCNFAILYFDISEDKVSRMHILLIMIFLNTLNHLCVHFEPILVFLERHGPVCPPPLDPPVCWTMDTQYL